MYQKKIRFWNRILFRMSIWVLLLGIASMLGVSFFVERQMYNTIESQVADELQMIQDNSELYIRQTLLIQNSPLNESGFEQSVSSMKEQLKRVGYQDAAFYDVNGKLLESTDSRRFLDEEHNRKDFEQAMAWKSAFTICYGGDHQCEVYFSMPVESMGRRLGLITYYLDYHEMYEREWNTLNGMIRVMTLAFFIIYLMIWLIIRRMISPVRRLSRISSDISRHLEDGEFDSEMIGMLRFNGRRDEMGELSRNYTRMIAVIREQFEKIQEDRDHILQLLNSRQEFYNNITHELKTPLTTISGYAQLMEENALEDEELFYNGLEHILQESTRLHQMVVQLLEMQDNRAYAGLERLNPVSVIKNVTETMQLKAKRYESKLVFECEEDAVYVRGREDRIRQVLINLIDNAIKYGQPEEEIRIQAARQNTQVCVSVSNKGKGITARELEHIFEPFYRIDKERSRELGSAGLGLSIARKIMEEHQGSIHAESIPNQVTTFTIYFPADSVADQS